ncbi:MAG: roadblock/LC7 domain-containing protein [Deltaproteobacteria bacterium]|nr:MAG: roadblock/LC7 domain-containing protein [Deltaproteobacteria bacterium]
MEYVISEEQLEILENVLREDFIELGVHSAILIDMAGNIIADLDNNKTQHDVFSLAALAAGNFGAVSAMAQIIGEADFPLLFHKGEKESMHFSKIMNDFLLITIFGRETSLGLVRLKVAEATGKLEEVLESLISK